jgi:WD40 repeat protein
MQYLSGSRPEGPFRIYHESFREFLLADQTYPVYAAEANQAIADYFLKVYGSRWHECKDRYAVAYTPVHLVESIWQTEEPLRRGERSEKLASLLEDFCFLEAKAGQVSVDDLLVDLHTATALELVRSGSLLELPDLLKVLEREGANLSGWDQELRPAFFAQQVLNRCKDMQLHGLAGVARARLKELGFPYFELRWRAGPLDAEEKRYHSTFSFWNAYTVSSLAVTPDGRLVVSAHLDGSLKVWDNATGRKVRTLMGHEAMVLAVAVTPDGLRAVSGSQDSTLKVWDLKTGRVQHTLVGHEGTIFTVRITPDGQRAVSRADDGLVRLWDLNSGQSLHALGKPKHPYYFSPALEEDGMENDLPDLYYGISEYALAVTPDSRRAIAALSGGFRLDGTLPGDVVKVWDLDTGLEVYALDGHSGQVVSIAVSPDGRRAVSASDDGTVKVWDLKLGRLAHTLSGHSDQVQAVLVTTDSRLVVSASLDSTVKVWDLSTGGLLRTLIGHGGQLYALASSADGRCIISGSFEGFLTVWSMQSGQELASVAVEGERPQLAIQQRNGILAGASDGDVYCLDYVEPSRPDPIADSSGGPNPRK